mgnify:CR=1 FL=1|tara:strand:+ start:128398 stop:128952 length:555 start_codon:yes stop_codon:yes gene_type:complete
MVAANGMEIYWNELTAYLARSLQDSVAAADLAQETYLRAAALPANTVLINPRAWLYATARNLLIDHIRRSRVRLAVGGPAEEATDRADDQPHPEAVLLAREELAVLIRALETLPPRTHEVFRLHKFEGMSYAEISNALGIAKNTVMVHMVKALGICRKAVQAHREIDEPTNGFAAVMRHTVHES